MVTGAKLRLFVDATSFDPLGLPLVAHLLSSSFVEGDGASGVTWSTEPAVLSSPVSTATMNAPVAEWFEMDVGTLVAAVRAGADPDHVWLRLGRDGEPANLPETQFRFRSKEHGSGADRPVLRLAYYDQTQAFGAVKDSFVYVNQSQAFGASTLVHAGFYTSAGTTHARRALLAFDTASLPADAEVERATLRLRVDQTSGTQPTQIVLHELAAGFDEATVTWTSQPGVNAAPAVNASMAAAAGNWFETDVTAIVAAIAAGATPDDVRLRVAAQNESAAATSLFTFRSRENGSGDDRAQLVLGFSTPLRSAARSAMTTALAAACCSSRRARPPCSSPRRCRSTC